jgi:hypothetical protein
LWRCWFDSRLLPNQEAIAMPRSAAIARGDQAPIEVTIGRVSNSGACPTSDAAMHATAIDIA